MWRGLRPWRDRASLRITTCFQLKFHSASLPALARLLLALSRRLLSLSFHLYVVGSSGCQSHRDVDEITPLDPGWVSIRGREQKACIMTGRGLSSRIESNLAFLPYFGNARSGQQDSPWLMAATLARSVFCERQSQTEREAQRAAPGSPRLPSVAK